jgi:hypothetical protein
MALQFTILFVVQAIFAVVTAILARRDGSGITRRAFNQPYTDAPGARTD